MGIRSHVILSISCSKGEYWVDPTITNQGGIFPNVFCPNYHWGLPVFPGSANLIPFPQRNEESVIDVNIEITVQSIDQAELSLHTTLTGRRADFHRRELGERGIKKLSEEQRAERKGDYRFVKILSPLAITDDRNSNVLSQAEHYLVSTRNRPGNKILTVPSCVLDYLDSDIELDRSAPYALSYPLWVKEHITINNPLGNWERESDELQISHPSLFYSYRYSGIEDTIWIDRELKHLQDHVPVDQIKSYLDAVDEIEYHDVSEVSLYTQSL